VRSRLVRTMKPPPLSKQFEDFSLSPKVLRLVHLGVFSVILS